MERLRKKCDEASHIDSKLRGLKEKNIIELEAEVKRTVSLIERSGKHLHELIRIMYFMTAPGHRPTGKLSSPGWPLNILSSIVLPNLTREKKKNIT